MKVFKYFENKFGANIWHLIALLEVMFYIFCIIRIGFFFLYLQDPAESPPHSTIVGVFFTIEFVFIIHPLKFWFLCKGINQENANYLKIYAILNALLSAPSVIIFAIYTRFTIWMKRSGIAVLTEVVQFFVGFLFYAWLVYWRVPQHLKKLELDLVALAKLEKHLKINELEKGIETNVDIKKFLLSSMNIFIDLNDKIGQGQYGIVYKGKILKGRKTILIAGKTSTNCEEDLDEISHEMRIALLVGQHPQIVGFFGVTANPSCGKYFLVTEYCSNGNLKDYLQKLKSSSESDKNVSINFENTSELELEKILFTFAKKICLGLAHLASKKVIHGDLAARNILLTECLEIKIADFGMSNKLSNYQTYTRNLQHELLPWRWLSVEVLEDLKFSEKSDVYAYGVTLYEVFSLGELPFKGLEWTSEFVKDIKTKKLTLPKPELCNTKMYWVMKKCWIIDLKERPSFKEILADHLS